MDLVTIDEIIDRQPEDDVEYTEFLHEQSMSVGIYSLPEEAIDTQSPHTEDEIYFVLSGSATLKVDNDEYNVQKNDLIFVEREAEHQFVNIEEDLELLVVFAPARGTLDTNN